MPGGISTKAQSSPISIPEADVATSRSGLCEDWNLDLRVWLSSLRLEILPVFDESLAPSIEEVFDTVVVVCDEDATEETLARTC